MKETFMKIIFLLTIILTSCVGGQKSETQNNEVKIGDNYWMTKNLSTKVFQNGDSIAYAETAKEWIDLSSKQIPAYCFDWGDSTKNGNGFIYNWYAVNDERGLAPVGWRTSNDSDWIQLANYLGNNEPVEFNIILGAPDSIGRILISEEGWANGINGLDSYGFNAKPSSWRRHNEAKYYPARPNTLARWWTQSNKNELLAICYSLNKKGLMRNIADKRTGFMVRCVKNE